MTIRSFPSTFLWTVISVALTCRMSMLYALALQCDLYMAESTIPNAGVGVFTAVPKENGDTIGNGDVVFPLLELPWYNGVEQLGLEYYEDYYDPFEDYVWDGITMGMGMESDAGFDAVTALWPGLDCAINCLIPLENVHRSFPQHNSHGDDLPYMPHRARDPGAGAVTTYRSAIQTVVKRDVPAGGELFKAYGDDWFISRPWMFDEGFPVTDSFSHAQDLLEKTAKSYSYVPLYNFLLDLREIWPASRTLHALPITEEDVELSLEEDITQTYQKNATRSLEWLESHGTCIDHIVHRPSTISGAGEGAFAKRDLPNGTIVTGSPLIVIPDKSFVDMPRWHHDETTDEWTRSPPIGKQITLNYCLGHQDSTMLLLPYGSGVHYINHNATLANIRLQWAEHGKLRHDQAFLDMAPEELEGKFSGPSLGVEYVAIRDVTEGEELFLDYGLAWEAAWRQHMENWTPPLDSNGEAGTTAADWNARVDEPIRTLSEQESNPYPDNIELRCHVDLVDPDWKIHRDDLLWMRYPKEKGADEYHGVYGLPCHALERSSDNVTYTVELLIDYLVFVELPEKLKEDGAMNVTEVPRAALFFLDSALESDLYLKGSFRFPIGIPEAMMPEAWRNKKVSSDMFETPLLADEL